MTEVTLQENIKTGNAGQTRAFGFFLSKQYEKALDEFERLHAKQPDNMSILSNILVCRYYLDRIDDDFMEGLFPQEKNLPPEGWLCLAQIFLDMDNLDNVIFFLNSIFDRDDANIESYLLRAEAFRLLGEGDELLALMRSAYPRFNNDPRILCMVAGYAADYGNMGQARYLLHKSLKLDRSYTLKSPHFYNYYIDAGKESDLIPYAEEALKIQPDNKQVLAYLAEALALTNQYEKSDAAYRRLSELYRVMPDELKSKWADSLYGQRAYIRAFDMAKTISDNYPYKDGVFLFLRKVLYLMRLEEGQREAAEDRAKIWRDENPDDIGIAHTCAAILGEKSKDTPPPEFAQEFFDAFAPDFDQALLLNLEYQGDELLEKALKTAKIPKDSSLKILDAGCGTGNLAASVIPYMLPRGKLVGVDISGGMLDIARAKMFYTELYQEDIVTFLHNKENKAQFDLITCIDVFSYFGNLSPALTGFYQALAPKGTVIFCVLKPDISVPLTYSLELSGQYVHSLNYTLASVTEAGLTMLSYTDGILRTEIDKSVHCTVIVAQKK